ncbi:hypothetical protein L7F22_047463 [Adiantum nelumboides]|nr:hypothetical protein [Adiantum nelumboides]
MEDSGATKQESINSFIYVTVPEIRTRTDELQAEHGEVWQDYKKALKEEYILEDKDRVTKQTFFKWIKLREKAMTVQNCYRDLKSALISFLPGSRDLWKQKRWSFL